MPHRRATSRETWLPLLAALSGLLVTTRGTAQAFHQRPPTSYRQAEAENVAERLDAQLRNGDLELAHEGPSGRLRPLLRALGVPESSQTLVFSKTSLQRHRVSPHNPRAIYFAPDVYVGFIPGAAALELAVGDDRLGLVFYTVPQDAAAPARVLRDDSCLRCHAESRTNDEPGVLVRSVFPDAAGDPITSAGETLVTHRTPFAERWGGWIVTGRVAGAHRGNGVAERDGDGAWRVPPRQAADLHAFAADFDAAPYPVATSDIGALLALEQQATVHNLLIRATLQVRYLEAQDAATNAALGEQGARPATVRAIDGLARELAAALLMDHEAPLDESDAAPDAAFARDFAALWPEAAGARLGELELRTRTFTLPMSPMVHAPAFRRMPASLRTAVLARLFVAVEQGVPPGGVSWTTAERLLLRDHLRAALPDWPPPRAAR